MRFHDLNWIVFFHVFPGSIPKGRTINNISKQQTYISYIYIYHIYTSWRLLRKLGVKTLGPCPPITSTSARSKSAESIWLTPDSGAISPGCTACLGLRLLRKHCRWKMFILIHALLLYLFPNKPLILSHHHHSLQTGS